MDNTYINESSIIPQNFNWRAGVGKDVSQSTNQGGEFNPFNPSFVPGQSFKIPQGMSPMDLEKNGQKNKEDLKFNQTLLQEIDTNVTDIIDKHKMSEANEHTFNQIKTEIRMYLNGIKNKYKNMIGPKFMELLYNTCLNSYTTQWLMICSNNGVSDFSKTEFVQTTTGFEINPFVIYTLMNTSMYRQEYVYEGQINS